MTIYADNILHQNLNAFKEQLKTKKTELLEELAELGKSERSSDFIRGQLEQINASIESLKGITEL